MMRAVLGHREGSEQAWAETNTGTEKGKNSLLPKAVGTLLEVLNTGQNGKKYPQLRFLPDGQRLK